MAPHKEVKCPLLYKVNIAVYHQNTVICMTYPVKKIIGNGKPGQLVFPSLEIIENGRAVLAFKYVGFYLCADSVLFLF